MPQSRRRRNRPSLGMPVFENYAKQKQLYEEAVPAEAFAYEGEPKHIQAINPFGISVVDTNITAKKLINADGVVTEKISQNQVSPILLDNELEIELEDKKGELNEEKPDKL